MTYFGPFATRDPRIIVFRSALELSRICEMVEARFSTEPFEYDDELENDEIAVEWATARGFAGALSLEITKFNSVQDDLFELRAHLVSGSGKSVEWVREIASKELLPFIRYEIERRG